MAVKGGINHITLRVQNLQRSNRFYSGLLGLKLVGKCSGMDFYSSGLYNHELALIEDSSITSTRIRHGGLIHLAFNIENIETLKTLYRDLIVNNFPVSAGVDHTISQSFYTHDPDGYAVELTIDQPRHEWELNPNAFNLGNSLKL